MVNFKKTIIGCLLLCSMVHQVDACEPAGFDFDTFLKHNDRNHDGFLQEIKLSKADFGEQQNILDKDITRPNAFRKLDSNQDHKISTTELWEWGQYTHNACANWGNNPKQTW